MFLKIEGERLVNLDLVGVVEMDHTRRIASVFQGGTRAVSDSHLLYLYYCAVKLEPMPAGPEN